MGGNANSTGLQVQVAMAQPDSHNLFEFSTDEHELYEFAVDKVFDFHLEQALFGRVPISTETIASPPLLSLTVSAPGQYTLTQPERDFGDVMELDGDRYTWELVGQGADRAQPLREGDYLKLGKLKLRISNIALEGSEGQAFQRKLTEESCVEEGQQQGLKEQSTQYAKAGEEEETQCRICFERGRGLRSVCKCKGSLKFIHERCLKDWVSNSLEEKVSDGYVHYSWVNRCEICCSNIEIDPWRFIKRLPRLPYIVVESKRHQKSHCIATTIRDQLTIGRYAHSNISIKDNSVSRAHCSLYFKGGQLMVQDCGSKFGTLKLLREPERQLGPQGIILQNGPHVLRITPAIDYCRCCSYTQ